MDVVLDWSQSIGEGAADSGQAGAMSPEIPFEHNVVVASLRSSGDGEEATIFVATGINREVLTNVGALTAPADRELVAADEILDWMLTSAPGALITVQGTTTVSRQGRLPKPHRSLFETDPVAYIDLQIERILEIETRYATALDDQRDLLESIEDLGCEFRTAGMSGGFAGSLDQVCLEHLMGDPTVLAVRELKPTSLAANTGIELREGHQIQQFLDNNLTGELGSGRGIFGNDIVIGVVDNVIDADHPAWLDTANGTSRLRAIRCFNSGVWSGAHCTPETHWTPWPSNGDSTNEQKRHGTWVAGQALADLTQGQVPNKSATWEAKRSGMSTESSLVFISKRGPTNVSSTWPTESQIMDRAISDGVDILIWTTGGPPGVCGDANYSNHDLRPAYEDGIFTVGAAGNQGHSGGCNIAGIASDGTVFTVGAQKKNNGGPRTANIANYSSRGGDSSGRNVVDLVAIGGRGGGTLPTWNNGYGAGGPLYIGTSFSAPIVGGAAANFKHQMINKLGASVINEPGRMHALMLLMGDRQTSGGVSSNSMDPVWGAGRLRMRKFNNAGMDEPWAFHSAKVTVFHGKTYTFDVNSGQIFAIPNKLPVASDHLRLAGWWLESSDGPNNGVGFPATIRVQLEDFDTGQVLVISDDSAPQHRRIAYNKIGGKRLIIRVIGTDVPHTRRFPFTTPLTTTQSRELHLAWYWEDSARDDSNGPPLNIQ